MPRDPLIGLFRRRFEIDTPGGAHEQNARHLERLGLIRIDEKEYVRCVNALDHDRRAAGAACPGRVYLRRGRGDEDYYCPDCEREVEPARKQRFRSIRIKPDLEAMRVFLREHISADYPSVEERPAGFFRIPLAECDMVVCLVDVCLDPIVASHVYPYQSKLVFVIGQERHRLRLPEDIPVFRLAEIALGGAAPVFLRTLHRLENTATSSAKMATWPGPRLWLARPGTCSTNDARSTRPVMATGTSWNQLVFYLVDGETIAVRVPGQRLQRLHHHELGLVDRRNGKPTKRWRILEGLCEGYGSILWPSYARTFGAFKEQVSKLRLILQTEFGIHADPFVDCSQSSGLRAAFQALPDLVAADPLERVAY